MTMPRAIALLTAPITLALAVALSTAASAQASSTTRQDPRNDVFLASVGGGIDLAAVQLKTLDRKTRIQVTFRLHSSPALERSLEKPGGLSVQFVKNARTLRVASIFTKDGDLRGEICSHTTGDAGGQHSCRRLQVTRVDARTYRTSVRLTQVKKGATLLRWTASSMDISNGDPVSDQLTAKGGEPFRWRL